MSKMIAFIARRNTLEILAAIATILALFVAIGAWRWPNIMKDSNVSCTLAITSLHPSKENLSPNEVISVTVSVKGCGENLTYVWSADNGQVAPSGPTAQSTVQYTAPNLVGPDTIRVIVRDKIERIAEGDIKVDVVQNAATP